MHSFFKDFQERFHSPPSSNWDLVTTVGRLDPLSKTLDMLLCGQGDSEAVVIAQHAPAEVLAAMSIYRPDYIIIEEDEMGIMPDKLASALKIR